MLTPKRINGRNTLERKIVGTVNQLKRKNIQKCKLIKHNILSELGQLSERLHNLSITT